MSENISKNLSFPISVFVFMALSDYSKYLNSTILMILVSFILLSAILITVHYIVTSKEQQYTYECKQKLAELATLTAETQTADFNNYTPKPYNWK